MITKTQLNFLRENKLIPTPVDPKTKKPKLKYGKWYRQWTDEEILSADAVAIFHKDDDKNQICAAVDFDDVDYVAHDWNIKLPSTMSVTKNTKLGLKVNQMIYKVNGSGFPKFDYGGESKEDGKLIECLRSGISIIHTKDRTFSLVKPVEVNSDDLLKKLKLSCFFTEVQKNFPSKTSKRRDITHLALQGVLARLDEKDYPTTVLEGFIKQLCINLDDDEIDNRVKKLEYQREQLKDPNNDVAGLPSLCAALGVKTIPAFDLLKTNVEEKEKPLKDYPIISFDKMLEINYPKPKFLLNPLIREKTVTQISGDYGSGKTHLGLLLAISISQGWNFEDWFIAFDKRPTLYVEGELPAADVRDRINSLLNPTVEKGGSFDSTKIFTLTLDDLEMNGHPFGFEPLAITNEEDKAKRNRKLIDNMLNAIKDRTGQYPVLFLDNITALTSIDENKSTDWSGLMMWLMLLKTKGVIIVFFHHTGKTTGTASGSNLSQRLVDTHLILKKLPEKAKFEEHDGVQCSVHFDKFRNFGGKHAKPFMLLCDKEGYWSKYNMLMDQKDFKILELYNERKSVEEMCKLEKELKPATVYRRIEKMKKEGIIKDEGSSNY